MINWGDGNSSAGTISGSGGSFNVTGSHTYAAVGTYPISVTITSVGSSLGSATVADSATVVPPTAPVVTGLSASSGPTAGGTSVTITGNNLTGATAVKFGPNGATNVQRRQLRPDHGDLAAGDGNRRCDRDHAERHQPGQLRRSFHLHSTTATAARAPHRPRCQEYPAGRRRSRPAAAPALQAS